jgi:hypothetical protein
VASTGTGSHSSRDIFNTGECKSATGLAISTDLDRWDWQGVVLAPGDTGWDSYCRRLNSIVPLPGGPGADRYLAFYDGSASHRENYEEKCALAVSSDLRQWKTRCPDGPALLSPHASTSLRYLDVKRAGDDWSLFYEFARADGSHDLRMIACDTADLAELAR